jgi:hypothetical protein
VASGVVNEGQIGLNRFLPENKNRINLAIRIINDEKNNSPNKYQSLFENSPISLWEEDFSKIKHKIDRLRESGITDLKRYFNDNPEELLKCARLVKVIDVNSVTVVLFKAEDKEYFFSRLWELFDEDFLHSFSEELSCLAAGKSYVCAECSHLDFSGNKIFCRIEVSIDPKFLDSWSRVLVAITNLDKEVPSSKT